MVQSFVGTWGIDAEAMEETGAGAMVEIAAETVAGPAEDVIPSYHW